MKNKIFLFPISLAVIFFASMIIIFSPIGSTKIINIPTKTSIYITTPELPLTLTNPTIVIGKVDRNWVFEGSFPVDLFDDQNQILFQGTASVPNWTEGTGELVDFTLNLNFTTSASSGYLIFRKDNPSGLPENDQSLTLPVSFSHNDPN